MKRLARWLFNLAAAVSLICGALVAGLWVRTIWTFDGVFSERIDDRGYIHCSVVSVTRSIRLSYSSTLAKSGQAFPDAVSATDGSFPKSAGWRRIQAPTNAEVPGWGFYWQHKSSSRGPFISASYRFGLPHWFILLICSVLPVSRIRVWRSSRITGRRGLCPICGYDLRATPERCPECGAIPSTKEAATP